MMEKLYEVSLVSVDLFWSVSRFVTDVYGVCVFVCMHKHRKDVFSDTSCWKNNSQTALYLVESSS